MNPTDSPDPQSDQRCPRCRSPRQFWPSLQGSQGQWLCPRCDLATGSLPTELPDNGREVQQSAPRDPGKRFRWLIEASRLYPPDSALPEWIIEDLPETVQALLRSDLNQARPNLGPGLSDALTSALRDQGYLIEEDARGIRLGGDLNRRHTGELSPYDVIRLASDLDGGIPDPENLRRCSKCEAVVSPNEARCPWCGETLPEIPPTAQQGAL